VLLVLVSVLGFVLKGHPHLQQTIVSSALGQFTVIGRELEVGALRGNPLALILGLAAPVSAGMGVSLAAENAMNRLWGIAFNRRPDFIRARAVVTVLARRRRGSSRSR
jgi:uncharacterized BrkB/YihY/UPF0761 family membrane protein